MSVIESTKPTLFDLSSTLYAVALLQAEEALKEGDSRRLRHIEADNPTQAEMMRAKAAQLEKYRQLDPEGVAFEQRFWLDLAAGFEKMVPAMRSGLATPLLDPDEINERARQLAVKYA